MSISTTQNSQFNRELLYYVLILNFLQPSLLSLAKFKARYEKNCIEVLKCYWLRI